VVAGMFVSRALVGDDLSSPGSVAFLLVGSGSPVWCVGILLVGARGRRVGILLRDPRGAPLNFVCARGSLPFLWARFI
jgi:hypothetical protein